MKTRRRGWAALRALLMRGLLVLIAVVFCQGPFEVTPASASPAAVAVSAADSIAAKKKKKRKKKKRKKKKRKKKKRKKKKRSQAPPAIPQTMAVTVLPFEEDGGGMAMASQVTLGITSMEQGNSNEMEAALSPEDRWSEASVRAAMAATKTSAVIRGIGRRSNNYLEVRIYAYADDGQIHYSETYMTPPGEMDPLALSGQIGDDLDQALPNLANLAVVQGPESWSSSGTTALTATQTGTNTGSGSSYGSSSSAASSSGTVEEKVKPKKEDDGTPMISVGAGLDTLYWSYDLQSDALENTVFWHPLEPYLGAAVAVGFWPMDYVGLDLRLDFGMHGYVDVPEIDQNRIDITAVAADVAIKGRFLSDFGLGVGAHVGYRYMGTFVSEQTPITVAPEIGSHLISPGLDLYVTALSPLLTLHMAGDVVPFGIYAEAPNSPGAADSASLWGWHIEGAARSTFFMGIYAELSFFYENYYISYTGQGDRQNSAGAAVADGRVTNGLRGVALGIGWSY